MLAVLVGVVPFLSRSECYVGRDVVVRSSEQKRMGVDIFLCVMFFFLVLRHLLHESLYICVLRSSEEVWVSQFWLRRSRFAIEPNMRLFMSSHSGDSS